MNKIKMITTGRLGQVFQEAVKDEFSTVELQVDYYETLDQKILDQYKAAAWFKIDPDLDISHLQWVHSFGAGVDGFIFNKSLNSATRISRTVGFMGNKIAEYCLGYILADHLKIKKNFTYQAKKLWDFNEINYLLRSSVAVLGTGEMGRKVGGTLMKLGCRVYGISRSGKQFQEFSHCLTIEDFIASPPRLDTLISVLPSTRKTAGLLDHKFFQNIADIHLMSIGRGDVIKENVLIELLEEGKLRRATLDVFSQEPLPESSRLWDHEKVIITPHQAAITDIDDVMISFREAFLAIKEGKTSLLFIDQHKGY